MNKALIPLFLLVLMLIGLSWALFKGDTKTLDFALEGELFPEFEQTELFDETRILTAADIKGKVTLVNVFGTWCPPCAVEHPKIMEISKSGQVRVVGLAWQRQHSREDAVRWLGKHGNSYDFVIFNKQGGLVLSLGVIKAPESYLVGAQGQLLVKHEGIMTDKAWDEKFVPVINALEAK